MNTQWLSYSLSDFILYSAQAFNYLLADYNQQQPIPITMCYLAGIYICICCYRRVYPRASLMLLALCWGYNGWFYYQSYYLQLNWLATYQAYTCYLLSGLLITSSFTAKWLGGKQRSNLVNVLLFINLFALPPLQYHGLHNVHFIQYPLSTPATLALFSLSLLCLLGSRFKLLLALTASFILLAETVFLYQLFLS